MNRSTGWVASGGLRATVTAALMMSAPVGGRVRKMCSSWTSPPPQTPDGSKSAQSITKDLRDVAVVCFDPPIDPCLTFLFGVPILMAVRCTALSDNDTPCTVRKRDETFRFIGKEFIHGAFRAIPAQAGVIVDDQEATGNKSGIKIL